MKVQVVAKTQFLPPEDVPWSTDAIGGEALAEFAGRSCYQSWNKPNPATATNAGYIDHILEIGHLSVLEHGTVTMYFTEISRALTHELIRHRHFSYSQLSQRFVADKGIFIEPHIIADDPELHDVFTRATADAQNAYEELVNGLDLLLDKNTSTSRRKKIREAARSVLPNATETKIVVTGNYRAYRHFILLRGTEHADAEIRELALTCLGELRDVAPNVFQDIRVSENEDGVFVASSPYSDAP